MLPGSGSAPAPTTSPSLGLSPSITPSPGLCPCPSPTFTLPHPHCYPHLSLVPSPCCPHHYPGVRRDAQARRQVRRRAGSRAARLPAGPERRGRRGCAPLQPRVPAAAAPSDEGRIRRGREQRLPRAARDRAALRRPARQGELHQLHSAPPAALCLAGCTLPHQLHSTPPAALLPRWLHAHCMHLACALYAPCAWLRSMHRARSVHSACRATAMCMGRAVSTCSAYPVY